MTLTFEAWDHYGFGKNRSYIAPCIVAALSPGHFVTIFITTGAFTPVGPLLAPVVKYNFQMSWALLIISKRLTLLKKLHLPALSYPLTFSTFPLYI